MRKVGDKRTFEKHSGEWEIKKIIRNKNIVKTIELESIVCPHCNYKISKPRNYIFDYIEELDNNGEKKYLGISNSGRYILLDDYIDKTELENELNEVDV